jgi:3-oxoacyl-[acyl-carrier protein] reductase
MSTRMTAELGRRFVDRVALVTGASRGIGLAVAARIVAEGGRVVITARKPEGIAAALDELGTEHAIAVAGRADDPEHQSEAVQAALDRFGRIDVLVNNAGVNPAYGPLTSIDESAARKIMDVNVLAALGWSRRAVEAGLGAGSAGAIVNIASIAGLRPSPGIAYYGVSKAALIGLTVQLAAELAPGVRVNAVAPAVVKTKFATALYAHDEEAAAAGYPLGRLGVPDDVAALVAFLASAEASWITGQTIAIDGGAGLRAAV